MNSRLFSYILTGIFLLASITFAQKPVEIKFMWWLTNNNDITFETIKAFETKYPHIKVKSEYCGKNDYYTKLMFALLGKTCADIIMIDWNKLNQIDNEYFYDLKNITLDLKNYTPSVLKQCTSGDKVICAPLNSTGRVFFYNKSTFDKAGIAVPKSFADLFSAAQVFKSKLGSDYYPFYLDNYDAWLMILMYCEQKHGKSFIDNNQVAYSIDELKSGFDFYNDILSKGVAPSVQKNRSLGAENFDQDERWIKGKFAGKCDWSSNADRVERSVPNGVIVLGETPLDYGKTSGAAYKISTCYSMYSQTKYPKETALFLNFLLTDSNALQIQKFERGMPINKVATDILNKLGLLSGFAYDAQKAADSYVTTGMYPLIENNELVAFYKLQVLQELPKTGSRVAAEKVIKKTNAYIKKFELE